MFIVPSLTAPPPGWQGQCLCYWNQSEGTWPCPSGFPAACLCPAAAPAGSQSFGFQGEGKPADGTGGKTKHWSKCNNVMM